MQRQMNMNRRLETTPLPTRVSRACQRCRRYKARCDPYRPCSLCLRANVECMTDDPVPGTVFTRNGAAPTSSLTPTHSDEYAIPPHKRRRRETKTSQGSVDAHTYSHSHHSHNSSQPSPTEPLQDHECEPAITIARKIHHMDSQHIDNGAVNAIPGADVGNPRSHRGSLSAASQAPTSSYLIHALPQDSIMVTLIEEYFDSVHWFSLVILESKFRASFDTVRGGVAEKSRKPFLLLLSTILGLASWYRGHVSRPKDGNPPRFWQDWSSRLLENSESQIIEIMDQNSTTAVQTLILLGSFYLYHGRPNLSFSLLGATVKVAQAAKLHREPVSGSQADREERKRVWWTIYTWDRFASITYGRPLGINDKDCNIGQPDDVLENPTFAESSTSHDRGPICFSAYQRELNKLYMIASPAIENIYNVPRSEHPRVASENLSRVRDVTLRLWSWRGRLPEQLLPRLESDCSRTLTLNAKVSCLQSLSLQLTFDSLIIVLHRPFIKQRVDLILNSALGQTPASVMSYGDDSNHPEREHPSPQRPSDTALVQDTSSHQQWWEAAIRTSRVTGLPQLAQFATDSHLVAFLAINLFNAAMVMVVVALSDPLADEAQEAKRAVARIYRLQETLGTRSTLSQQSSSVLRSLVQMLLRRENDAILAPMPDVDPLSSREEYGELDHSKSTHLSVRDALSIPLGQRLDDVPYPISSKAQKDFGRQSRLNDSLTTVQKAFTAGSNVDLAGPTPSQSSRATSQGGLRAEFPYTSDVAEDSDMYQSGVDLTGSDRIGTNMIDDTGLYWFWDSTWDDLYTDAFVPHM